MSLIAIADPIAAVGIDRLRNAGHETVDVSKRKDGLESALERAEGLIVRSETKVTVELLEMAPQLRVVGRAGAGVDNIDVEAATRRGVVVVNAPTGNTLAAAEHTIALLLALVRNIPAADASVRAGNWERSRLTGVEVRGKTLGIVGLGKVGSEVARLGSALGMRVLAHDPVVSGERAGDMGVELVSQERVWRDSDIITLHTPLTPETKGLLGEAALALTRRGVRIINVARGGLVDEEALAKALHTGRVAGAALDVFAAEPLDANHPLRSTPNTILTPHLGASTHEAQAAVSNDVATEIIAVLAGKIPRYGINTPSLTTDESSSPSTHLALAETLGSWGAQLSQGEVTALECLYAGDLAYRDTSLITATVVSAVLRMQVPGVINTVNARLVAAEFGVIVTERRTLNPSSHNASLTVKVTGATTVDVGGTEIDGEPHITLVDGYRVDVAPTGYFVIGTHEDRPGVIAAVTAALADHNVNIAGIYVGRDRPGGTAVMILNVDDKLDPTLLEAISTHARLVRLRAVSSLA